MVTRKAPTIIQAPEVIPGANFAVDILGNPLPVDNGGYLTVAASQTDHALGTGAIGDLLAGILIIPATTSPGVISVKDGGGSAISVFAGGASSVSNLNPIWVPLGMVSKVGGWTVTTGANVSIIARGSFTP